MTPTVAQTSTDCSRVNADIPMITGFTATNRQKGAEIDCRIIFDLPHQSAPKAMFLLSRTPRIAVTRSSRAINTTTIHAQTPVVMPETTLGIDLGESTGEIGERPEDQHLVAEGIHDPPEIETTSTCGQDGRRGSPWRRR